MKRWNKVLSLALVLALVLGLSVPAFAEGADDAALQAVTLKVKNVLDLDTEIYTDFSGWPEENVLTGTRWTLQWSGDGVWLSITADNDGKIYSYYKSDSSSDEPIDTYGGRFKIPSLPSTDIQKAQAAARSFLDKVLTEGLETVELSDPADQTALRQTSFRFGGTVQLNGLPSPISCSLTVRASDNEVIRFWRTDERAGYMGALPSPDTKISDTQARVTLRDSLTMKPFYVLQADGKTARVTYLPQYGDEYYVDGKTGKLVNLTELRKSLYASSSNKYTSADLAEAPMAAEDAAASMAGGATLTQTELDGAAKLAGAMDKDALDQTVQNAWPEIGLKNYTLSGVRYWVTEREVEDGETEYDVTCRMTYGKLTSGSTAYKYLTVNAKTGELLDLYSYRPYDENLAINVRTATALASAKAVLKIFAGDNFDKLELYDTHEATKENRSNRFSFTFCHAANGYFYTSNQYSVSIDAVDGTLAAISGWFDDEVELVHPGKIFSESDAIAAYVDAMDLYYGYLEVPSAINMMGEEIYKLLKDTTYTYVNTLKPGFVLTQPSRYISGVDAGTCEPVQAPETEPVDNSITYDDVADTWVETAALALAKYNIGFPGGSLDSSKQLTQLDMLALLASVDGFRIGDLEDEDSVNYLYQHCYYLRLVTPETRDPEKVITRADLVKLILDGAGYQKVAALPGIFLCSFSDASSIPADHYGYAALAQGLGLVRGDEFGAYAATREATRGEAVAMLYQYMK